MLSLLVQAVPTLTVVLIPLLLAGPSRAAPTRAVDLTAAGCTKDDGDCSNVVNSLVETGASVVVGEETSARYTTGETFDTKEKIASSSEPAGDDFVKVKITQRAPVDNGESNVMLEPKKRFGPEGGFGGGYGGCCHPYPPGCCRGGW